MACTSAFPKPLSRSEEEKYLRQYFDGSTEAKNILIEHNLRLVAHVSKKYISSGIDNDDLISIGTIGLIKGISSFDENRKTRLATYCAKCIENEILMYLRSLRKSANDIFLQEPISKDKDGNEITVMEMIADQGDTVSDKAETNLQTKQLYQKLDSVLTKREKLILCLRYGIGVKKELTQREISKKLGISRSYVSRIEKKAIKKLSDDFKKSKKNSRR
jgi:RNA polymerase sporulation-specific sigma factor